MLIIRGYLYMQSRDKIICAAMTLAIIAFMVLSPGYICLLYTSDAADD